MAPEDRFGPVFAFVAEVKIFVESASFRSAIVLSDVENVRNFLLFPMLVVAKL